MYARLREKIGNAERALLKNAGAACIKSRNSDCEFESQSVSGGTAYHAVYLSWIVSRTKTWTKQLSGRVKIF